MFKTTSLLLASSMFGAAALAGYGDTSILIDNRFDGKAEVYIDGYFSGEIRGDTQGAFNTRPGMSDVLVLRDGGAVLLSTRVQARRGESTLVRVIPPEGTLFVKNAGRAPLLVSADSESVWVSPGTSANLVVTTGNVALTSKIQDRRGRSTVVDRQTVWVEPGKRGSAVVKYEPPIRTGVLVKNRDSQTVRVRIGGVDYGLLRPGAEMFVAVAQGSKWVTVNRQHGSILFNDSVFIRHGTESKVVVDDDKAGKMYTSKGSKVLDYEYYGGRHGHHRPDRHGDHGRSRWRW